MADTENKYEGFTLSLAVVDALPVLLFGGSSILIGTIFNSPLFLTGACVMFAGGFFKVMWKVLLAVKNKDVVIFNKQFRYTMTAGFVLILISLIVDRANLSLKGIFSGVTSFPACIFFILWALGMIGMGILGKKLDSSKSRSNWIEQCVNSAAQLCLFIALLILAI